MSEHMLNSRYLSARCRGLVAIVSLLSALVICATPTLGRADTILPREYEGVEIENKLGAQAPLDLKFKDEQGREVTLSKYFNQDRPVIVSFVYFKCPHVCTLVLNEMIEGIKKLGWRPGDKYEIVTLSISPTEDADLARAKKQSYLDLLDMEGAGEGWHFLTGEHDAIKRFTSSMGFGYRYDPKTTEYAHGTALFFLSPEGKLTRYLQNTIYDRDELPKQLRLSLNDASGGTISGLLDKALSICFLYEADSQKYSFYIWGAVRLGGALTVLAITLLLAVLWSRERLRTRAPTPEAPDPAEEASSSATSHQS